MVLDLARRLKFRASRLLIPVSFFGMLGGTLTLVGTSTSILASSLLREEPSFGRDIGMFEFTGVGVIVLLTGLVYFVTIGRWLLPRQDVARAEEEARDDVVFEAERYRYAPVTFCSCGAARGRCWNSNRREMCECFLHLARGRQKSKPSWYGCC
jgi:di/tricarboxylate transporter